MLAVYDQAKSRKKFIKKVEHASDALPAKSVLVYEKDIDYQSKAS